VAQITPGEPPMRIADVCRLLFAATFVGIGLWGLFTGDFGAVWQPVAKAWPAREALIYACALVSLGAGLGLLWRRTAAPAAGVLAIYLLLWVLVFKARPILAAPLSAVTWESAGETTVQLAAALTLFATLWARPSVATGARGLHIARAIYGLSLIAFGAAHFAYAKPTASLVPGWLPAHMAWAYLTGSTYVAAGLAVLSGVLAGLAARLAALQIGLFTLLVWGPAIAAPGAGRGQWSEAVLSWALTVSAAVIAAAYAGTARPERRLASRPPRGILLRG
jgi:uncharacterized membrane protein